MAKKKAKKTTKKAVTKRNVANNRAASKPKKSIGLAVIALILNVLILPGLGSLIARRISTGLWQIIVFLVGALLSWFFLPLGVISFAAWVWALVTGVNLIRESE